MIRLEYGDYEYPTAKERESLDEFKHHRENHGRNQPSALQNTIPKAQRTSNIELTQEEIIALISILHFSCTAFPLSQISENINHGLVQRTIVKLLENLK